MSAISSISDADLLKRRLFTSSPLDEPNLTMTLPASVQMNGILAAYDHRAFKLPCAECGAARHYKGFVVELSDGRRTLLGNHCGSKVFGDVWIHHHTQFRRLYDRQSLLRRRDELMVCLPKLVASAVALQRVVEDVSKALQEFEKGYPKITAALKRVAEKEDGWLDADVAVPDPEDPSAAPRFERRRLGRLAGRNAFAVRSLRTRLENARLTFADAWRAFSRENIEDRVLNKAVKESGDAISVLSQAVIEHNDVIDLLDPRNLRLIAVWAASQPVLSEECPNGSLVREAVVRREEIKVEKRRVVAIRRLNTPQKRLKAQKLYSKALKDRRVDSLPETSPKYFYFKEISTPKKLVKVDKTVIRPPNVSGIQRLDPAELQTAIGAAENRGLRAKERETEAESSVAVFSR